MCRVPDDDLSLLLAGGSRPSAARSGSRGSASVRSRARGCGSCARCCARDGSIRPTCSKVQWFPSLQAAKIFDDEDHPGEEQREIIIGHSTHEHLLLVSLTQREGAIRIISARKATRHERKDYEEGGK